VGYVYIGWLEHETYPAAGLRKFTSSPELFELVYDNQDTRIYRVKGGETDDVFTPTRESIPAAPQQTEREGPPRDEPETPPSILAEASDAGGAPYAQLKEPRDACVDERGRLWVADFGNSRLRVYDSQGGSLGGWGGRGNGNYGLKEPSGVASRGNDLYVADTWNGRVLAFTIDGVYKAAAAGLYGPRGIAAAEDGTVWVTDTGNNRVVQYDSALSLMTVAGKAGKGPEDLSGPVGIATGPSGRVYVADTGNRRIQVLDSKGKFVKNISFPGWVGSVEAHLEVDKDETLWVTDATSHQVVLLDPSGQVIRRIDKDQNGAPLTGAMGIALDRKARIVYIVNTRGNAIYPMPIVETSYQ
jgi:DNA-binding beta-propeller fold protein YncE